MRETYNFSMPVTKEFKQPSTLIWTIILVLMCNVASCDSCNNNSERQTKQNSDPNPGEDGVKATMYIIEKVLQESKKEVEVAFEGITPNNLDKLQLVVKGEDDQHNDQIVYYHGGSQQRLLPADADILISLKDLLPLDRLSQGKGSVKFNLQPGSSTQTMNMTFKLIDNSDGAQLSEDILVVWTKQAMKLKLSSNKQGIVGEEVLQVEIQNQGNTAINTNEIEILLVSSKHNITFDVGKTRAMKNGDKALLSNLAKAPLTLNPSDKLFVPLQLNGANNEKLSEVYFQAYNKQDGQLIGNMKPVTWSNSKLQLKITPSSPVAMGNQQVEVQIENVGQRIKTSDIKVDFKVPTFSSLGLQEPLFLMHTDRGVEKDVLQGTTSCTLYDLLGEEFIASQAKKIVRIKNLCKTPGNEVVLAITAINKADHNKEIGNSGPITWKNISLLFETSSKQFSKDLEVTVTNQGSEVNLADINIEMLLAGAHVNGTQFDLGHVADVASGGKVTLAQILQSTKLQANQQKTFKIHLAHAGVTMSADITLKATIQNDHALVGFLNNIQWKGIMLQASVQHPKLYGNQSTTITLTNTGLDAVATKDLKIELVHGKQGLEYKLGGVEKIAYKVPAVLDQVSRQATIQPGESVSFEMAVTDEQGEAGPIYFQLVIKNQLGQVVVDKISFIIWQKTGIEVTTDKNTIHGKEAATITIANAGDQPVDVTGIGVRLKLNVPGMELVTFRLGNCDIDFNPVSGVGDLINTLLVKVLPGSTSSIPINSATSFQVNCIQPGSVNQRDFIITVYDTNTSLPIKELPLIWKK